MEDWAEVRRLVLVERLSQREVIRRTGLPRDTVARMLMSEKPPSYAPRPKVGSKLDLFRDWISAQLAANPELTSQRLREMATEMGYEGGRNIFDTFVREVRPRVAPARRFSGRFTGRRS